MDSPPWRLPGIAWSPGHQLSPVANRVAAWWLLNLSEWYITFVTASLTIPANNGAMSPSLYSTSPWQSHRACETKIFINIRAFFRAFPPTTDCSGETRNRVQACGQVAGDDCQLRRVEEWAEDQAAPQEGAQGCARLCEGQSLANDGVINRE